MGDTSANGGNAYTTKASHEDTSHQTICSLFLGPQAENFDYFKENVITILKEQRDARLNYFPEDGVVYLFFNISYSLCGFQF